MNFYSHMEKLKLRKQVADLQDALALIRDNRDTRYEVEAQIGAWVWDLIDIIEQEEDDE